MPLLFIFSLTGQTGIWSIWQNKKDRIRILVWEGDDEFQPNAQVLYSDNFADGFAAEDRVVAGDILISTIKSYM